MWEVSVVRSLKTYQLAATLVFIKTLASCVIQSDKGVFMGMTRGLRWVDVTAHPLKGLLSRPCTVLPPPPSVCHSFFFSSQLFSPVGAGTKLWLLGITCPFFPSFFLPTERSFKSLPSSLILLFLLHHHNASSTQTNHRLRGDLSHRTSVADSPTIALTALQTSCWRTIQTQMLSSLLFLTELVLSVRITIVTDVS